MWREQFISFIGSIISTIHHIVTEYTKLTISLPVQVSCDNISQALNRRPTQFSDGPSLLKVSPASGPDQHSPEEEQAKDNGYHSNERFIQLAIHTKLIRVSGRVVFAVNMSGVVTSTLYTAVSTKVVPQKRKSVRDNVDWYYG